MRDKTIRNGKTEYRKIQDPGTYPQLKRGLDTGVIVLFLRKSRGTIVKLGTLFYDIVGRTSDDWAEERFEAVEEYET